MERLNKDRNPIFYKNAEEMDKPLSQLMEELRTDIGHVRGKLYDIKRSYGWGDRLTHLEGGLTCMLVAMYATMEEFKEFEDKEKENTKDDSNCNLPHVSTALPSEKKYEIDFGGNVLTKITIINNEIIVIQAINGYGDAVEKDKIRITERQ